MRRNGETVERHQDDICMNVSFGETGACSLPPRWWDVSKG